MWELWEDAMMMYACSISNVLDDRYRKDREDRYLALVKKYSREDMKIFVEIYAEIVTQMDYNPEQDFLGDLYMTLDLGSHWHGQFFTPYSICAMMAQMSVQPPISVENIKPITINDPACGGGALLIAGFHTYRKQLEKLGLNAQNYVAAYAQDLSLVAGLMCYIQLSLQGIAAKVKIADSLLNPMVDADDGSNIWYTPMWFSDVWTSRRLLKKLKGANA
jgi:type I restriction-modification system DNA methylase subunit